jgi:ribosomal protein L30E
MKPLTQLQKALEQQNVTIGTNETIRNLKAGNAATVYLAENAEQSVKEDIQHYAKVTDTDVEQLNIANDELGTICKKPFNIQVVSVNG